LHIEIEISINRASAIHGEKQISVEHAFALEHLVVYDDKTFHKYTRFPHTIFLFDRNRAILRPVQVTFTSSMDAHEERANTSENVIEFQIYPAETTNSIHELKDDIMGILTKEVSGYIWQTEPFSLDVKEGINQQLNKHETTFNFNQFFFYK